MDRSLQEYEKHGKMGLDKLNIGLLSHEDEMHISRLGRLVTVFRLPKGVPEVAAASQSQQRDLMLPITVAQVSISMIHSLATQPSYALETWELYGCRQISGFHVTLLQAGVTLGQDR